jgi:DNA-binding NarL/FixJ family response regulator
MRQLRVIAVDDEQAARESISLILDFEDDIVMVGTAATGHEAVEAVELLQPDVAVMDLRMPRMDGIEATRHITTRPGNRTSVLALTTFATDDLAISAIRAGAAGFCSKADAALMLASAVRTVASGEAIVSPRVLRVLLHRLIPAVDQADEVCSAREMEVLRLVAEGLSNPEIADRLVISDATVRTHIQHLRLKLVAKSRAHLVVRAHELGLVPRAGL